MRAKEFGLLVALAAIAGSLQGCGGGGGPSPSPTPPGPGPSPSPACPGWKTHPIEVRGQHLYDSVTGAQWRAKGIGFPNLREANISDWVQTLHRIKSLSPSINLVRVYELPECVFKTDCFEAFMKAADGLGVYVLVPGTGTIWGYLPNQASACGSPPTANGCYKAGSVLGFGQLMIQKFHFPNTLAVVIGNEYDQKHEMWPFQTVVKAYARDLKRYMKMCDTHDDSPTKGKMRHIPLLFASSDDSGDAMVKPKAEYYFCGSSDVSIDIFGLNVERWCNPDEGHTQYGRINSWVSAALFPGSFLFTEMGCSKYGGTYSGTRDWKQVPQFFKRYPAVDGYVGYTYFGNPDFDMFDAASPTAAITEDGKNFFSGVNSSGTEPKNDPESPTVPRCASKMGTATLDALDTVKWYDTGSTGWAPQCPKPCGSPDIGEDGPAKVDLVV